MLVRGIYRRIENFQSILFPSSSLLSTNFDSSLSLLISSVPKSSSASSSLPVSSLRLFCCGNCNLSSRAFFNNGGNEKCQRKSDFGNYGNGVTLLKRYFGYYRFHKQIGRGHWSRFQERYMRPRALEHTQRLMFNYSPRFQDSKRSAQWLWNLPKRIARATTSDEVLDIWVYYRHKRKRLHHYLMVLKRLVDVGGCDPSDWRFRLIAFHVTCNKRRYLNLPKVGLYLSKLKASADLQLLSRVFYIRARFYSPNQLCQIAEGISRCKVQDKQLLGIVSRYFEPHLVNVPVSNLVCLTNAFADSFVYNYKLFAKISAEIQRRMSLTVNNNEKNKRNHIPSIQQLADIGDLREEETMRNK